MNLYPSLFNTAAEGANAFRLLASAPSTTATQRRTCDVRRIPSQRSCDGFFAVFIRRRVLLNVGRCCQVMMVLGNANSRPPFPPQLNLGTKGTRLLRTQFHSRTQTQSKPQNVMFLTQSHTPSSAVGQSAYWWMIAASIRGRQRRRLIVLAALAAETSAFCALPVVPLHRVLACHPAPGMSAGYSSVESAGARSH